MNIQLRLVFDKYSNHVGGFKPNPIFYKKVGINHKRFAMLLRGSKEPVTSELKALSEFFNVPITELI